MLRFKTVTALALVGLLLACSKSNDDDDTYNGDDDDSADTGSGGSNGGSGKDAGADSDEDSGDGTGSSAGSSSTSDGGDDFDVNADTDACATLSVGAQGKSAMLMMVIDISNSMLQTAPSTGGASKWEATQQALLTAIPNLPKTLAVGVVFFPNVSVAGKDPAGCADGNSLLLDPVPLSDDAEAQRLTDLVAATEVDIPGTPTFDAYAIGIQRLQAALADPPPGFQDASGYVVLATDGMPTHTSDCGDAFGMGDRNRMAVSEAEWQEILDLGDSMAANEGINTFVVGVPGSENTNQVPCADANGEATHDQCEDGDPLDYVPMAKLSELAVMGRTAVDGCTIDGPRYCQIDLTTTDDLVIGLQRAIGAIAASVVSCEYKVPTKEEIQETAGPNVFPDYNAVVVDLYANGSNTVTEQLQRSKDDCETGGWQYNADKSLITLCDATCGAVKVDPYAAIEINFGCVIPQ